MRVGPWSLGRARCAFRKGRRGKLVYGDLADAWLGAFLLFADTGRIASPYRCCRTIVVLTRLIVCRNGNPWSVRPYETHRAKDQFVSNGCDRWHLTTRTWFMLPKGVRDNA